MPDSPQAPTFTVLAGPLKGRRVVVDDSVDEVLIGSDADCRLSLDLPGVSPLHARVWIDAEGVVVHDTRSPRGLYINDTRVEGQARLADGDVVWLGPPGDADSVMIQFRQPAPPGAAPVSRGAVAAAPPPAAEPAPIPDSDDEMLAAFFVPDGAEPVPETTASPPSEPIDDFVYDEPAVGPAADALASSDVMDFLVDEPVAAPAPPARPPVVAPAPLPVVAPVPPEEDLFFVEDVAASSPAAAPAAAVPAPPTLAPPAAPPPAPPAPGPAPTAAVPPPPAVAAPAPPAARAEAPARPAVPDAPRPRRPPASRTEAVRTATPPRSPRRSTSPRLVAIAALALVVLAAGGFALTRLLGAPSIRGIEPGRVRAGDAITITGRNFASDAGRNLVHFEGTRPGRVLQASSSRLQVEVPDIPSAPGRPNRVPVTVTVGGRLSDPMDIAVYLAPRVHGLAPSVAMPGEEVVLAGTGWGPGAAVAFGGRPAEVLETTATALRVRVPAVEGPPGTSAPVVVTMAGETSNPAPFLIGHLPLLLSVEPRTAAPGDVLVMSGRGFHTHAPSNDVRIGGTPALVVSSDDAAIRVLVPWVPAGSEVPVDVKVPGSDFVGQATLGVQAAADPIEFRFTAEPMVDQPDHDHALLSTALGPAFVVSASGGRTAAARAAEAVRRLNDAAAALKASLAQDVEMRGLDVGSPALVLTGTGETLLDITEEDAAAYGESWSSARGRGAPVTRARLAVWWGALARDLVRLLVRWEAPQHAAALAPEGRSLAEVHAAARRTGRLGVPRAAVERASPALRTGLRALALRVPAAVTAPADAAPPPAPGATAAAAPGPAAAPSLEGDWTGREVEDGTARPVNVTFTREGGSLSYQRALSLTLPLLGVETDRRGNVRYSMQTARGARYYAGRWDGEKIQGRIYSDPERQQSIGTFSLERIR
jgi:hypothetical protein